MPGAFHPSSPSNGSANPSAAAEFFRGHYRFGLGRHDGGGQGCRHRGCPAPILRSAGCAVAARCHDPHLLESRFSVTEYLSIRRSSSSWNQDCNRPLLCDICKAAEDGEGFLGEFELYAADLLVGVAIDIALVKLLAPCVRFRKLSSSMGLLGRLNRMSVSLPTR